MIARLGRFVSCVCLASALIAAPWTDSRADVIAPGYKLTISGSGSSFHRINEMAFKPGDSSHLYATRGWYDNGKITRYDFDPTTGLLTQPTDVFSVASIGDGFNVALGLGIHGSDLWLTRTKASTKEGKLTRLRDTDGNGTYDDVQDFVTGLHTGNNITQIAIRGNELFFGVGAGDSYGSPSLSQPYMGTIIRVPNLTMATATDISDTGYLDAATGHFLDTTAMDGRPHLYASGFRNPFGLHVDPHGALWVSDNSSNAGTNELGQPFPATHDVIYKNVSAGDRGVFPPAGQPGGGGATMQPWADAGEDHGAAGITTLSDGSALMAFCDGWQVPYHNSVGLFSPNGTLLNDAFVTGFKTPGDYPVALLNAGNDRILVADWDGDAVFMVAVPEPGTVELLATALAVAGPIAVHVRRRRRVPPCRRS